VFLQVMRGRKKKSTRTVASHQRVFTRIEQPAVIGLLRSGTSVERKSLEDAEKRKRSEEGKGQESLP